MDFLEALNEYYKLKNEYDTKKQTQINSILKDDNLKTFKQKRTALDKIKPTCIGCKKQVGTNFSIKDGVLMATCGSSSNTCNLDIKINRGKYIFLDELVDVYDTSVLENKEDIIQIKLDLLFNYKNETEVLSTFKSLKSEITTNLDALVKYKTEYIDTMSNLKNKSDIVAKMYIFYNKVDTIKETIQEYDETNNIQLIKDVVSLYRTELEPVLMDLRRLKYKYQAIEFNERDNTYCLKRKSYTMNEMVIAFDEPKVISFTIGSNAAVDAAIRTTKPHNTHDSSIIDVDEEDYLL